MRGHAVEAAELFVLGEEREEGVEHGVDQREAPAQLEGGEVAHVDGDVGAAGLGPEFSQHCVRGVDSRDRDPLLPQWKCDSSRADSQLQGVATLGQALETVDHRSERPVAVDPVVDAGDAVAVGLRLIGRFVGAPCRRTTTQWIVGMREAPEPIDCFNLALVNTGRWGRNEKVTP
jgi:hypothetical protein